MMLTSLQKMVGLPVVWQDRQMGYVERAVPSEGAKRLEGVVVRRGIGSAKWVPLHAIIMVGEQCMLISAKPEHMPDGNELTLSRAFLTTGFCVGEVTDVVLVGATLKPTALEVSGGPLYRLMGRSGYAADYRVCGMGGGAHEVIVPKLISWAELKQSLGEEESE
ncbi:MAG: hypothetical protein RR653_12185 [Clostridia bacterium]